MKLFKPRLKRLIEQKDYDGLNRLLLEYPELTNEPIGIPFKSFCRSTAHPLYRICDGVFARKITKNEAIRIAKILLHHGADIDGDKNKGEGTPLLAAASLHAEHVGIFYIEQGADVHYTQENDGASALHWAAYCGRHQLVKKLISTNVSIDKRDNTYKRTPLGWAIHCLHSNDMGNKHQQLDCIKLLLGEWCGHK